MFFILSKTLDFLLVPFTWILLIFGYALFTKHSKRKKRAYRVSFCMLLFFTNSIIINSLMLFWEKAPTPLKQLQKHDIGIILTGTTNPSKSPKDRVYIGTGADRILHTLMLYRQGKIKKIIITGGVVSIFGKVKESEAKQLARILKDAKVPEEDIILETKAKNTYENAQFTAKILKKRFPKQKYLLISSAFHLPRAEGCFLKQGVKVTPFAVDFYTTDIYESLSFSSLIPSIDALRRWSVLTHEVAGYMIYKLTGKS